MIMLRALLSFVVAAGVVVSVAYAQEQGQKAKGRAHKTAEEKFKELNKAGDGKLTLAEYLAPHANTKEETKKSYERAFKKADKGNKGYLTLAEFKSIPPKHHKKKPADDKAPAAEKKADGGAPAPEKKPDDAAKTPAK
jgi:hypothetical protein